MNFVRLTYWSIYILKQFSLFKTIFPVQTIETRKLEIDKFWQQFDLYLHVSYFSKYAP